MFYYPVCSRQVVFFMIAQFDNVFAIFLIQPSYDSHNIIDTKINGKNMA